MYPADSRVFQSLSGFQVRCNARAHEGRARKAQVSIPIGFSSSLQLFLRWLTISQRKSFNPYRVFKFVATGAGCLQEPAHGTVSIPIGFSSSLQHNIDLRESITMGNVSIPIGFSSSLQQQRPPADGRY